MNAIVLCAGFATRMYPITKDVPKPLLPIAGKPVIDYLMDQIHALPGLRRVHIVTNARFFGIFERWQRNRSCPTMPPKVEIKIHNDGSTANEKRLGAAADLQLGFRNITQPSKVLVSAGDNIFRFHIEPLWQRFLKSADHFVVALPEMDQTKLKKTGVLILEKEDRVARLHEKPVQPPSKWYCPPLYFLQDSVRPRLDEFVQTSDNRAELGHFIDFLCQREKVYAFKLQASRLDVGTIDTYREADERLRREPVFQ
jgi:glucose-1-phosphate thymidylyltransferase